MVPTKSWSDKLKAYRIAKAEGYAKAILSPPTQASLYGILPFPGVVLVMGRRRGGKTGLAHETANILHKRRKVPAVLHLPTATEPIRKAIQKLLPEWVKVVTSVKEWPKNCIVLYDEASQSAHARRSQSGDAVALDNLIGISGQRNQLIIFISHHSRKVDLNLIHECDAILWKEPTYAHQMFERDEMSDFTMKAYDFFHGLKTPKVKMRTALALDLHGFRFLQCTNGLPPWWNEDLSRLFQNIQERRC